MNSLRPIALHLPQFHPFPENDEWWGKGFTEWTNVTKARPLYKGHYQPHLPSDLGYYDLRLERSMKEQADLARAYGIYGFCYYHYWFNGKRLMHEPLDALLANRQNDFPFMYCWANENWSRRWDGAEQHILIKQDYSNEDDLQHIRWLCENVFSDPRYIRVDGKPFFAIYRPGLFPDIQQTLKRWREEAVRLGHGELYVGYMQSFNLRSDPASMGFDAAIEFQPDFFDLPVQESGSIVEKLAFKVGGKKSAYQNNTIVDYTIYMEKMMARSQPGYKRFPGITPMWDNTARRKNGAFILKNSSPEKYQRWLENIYRSFTPFSTDENFLFINAWNEWAEGNHLEPCQKWGRQYLESTKMVVDKYGS
jgi:lipopolysaccharide biosynthesis protein